MEDREERLRGLSEELSRLKSLVEHAGWRRLMEIAEGQCKNREPTIFSPLENFLELGKQEFEKGEVAGIKLFMVLPHKRIADLEESLESIANEREPESSPAAGGESRADDDGFEPATP